MIEFKKSTTQSAEAINEAGFTNKSENDAITKSGGGSDASAAIASFNEVMAEDYESKGSAWKKKLD